MIMEIIKKFPNRYLVSMYDDFDEPRHQPTQYLWTDCKDDAHKHAVKFVDHTYLKFADVIDTTTCERISYSWFRKLNKKVLTLITNKKNYERNKKKQTTNNRGRVTKHHV